MQTNGHSPKSFPIVYCTYQPPYSGNLPTPNYGHWSHAPMDKINIISLRKWAVSTYWCKRVEKYLLFLKTLAISIRSSMFQGLSALKESSCTLAKLSNMWHATTGKGHHITADSCAKESYMYTTSMFLIGRSELKVTHASVIDQNDIYGTSSYMYMYIVVLHISRSGK